MRTILLLFLSGLFARDVTTDLVDDIESRIRQNRDAFLSGRQTSAEKAQALAYYDAQREYLTSRNGCGARTLGAAGPACIEDRSRDGRWPWARYYRDPIERAGTVD